MRQELMERCELLKKNKEIVSKVFKWDEGIMNLAAASIFASNGYLADAERLKECENILKSETSAFSEFRGNVKVPLLCKMTMADDAQAYFEKIESIYKSLNKHKWMGNEYKIMAAMTIGDCASEDEAEKYVEATNAIYDRMKKEHKWLTSDSDIPFAAMLAVSEKPIEVLIEDMEKDFSLLKEKFHDSDAVQTLSHVLALYDMDCQSKCKKVVTIYDELKAQKHKYGSGKELATLGAMTTLELPEKELAEMIGQVDDYLKNIKGFGNFSLGEKERRMYAAQVVLTTFDKNSKGSEGIVLSNMLALTIAVEICMIICMTACVTTVTTSNH